jgi:hypothetical protein
MVTQDPEYLKNQSSRGHARYRWYRAYLNAVTMLWTALFGALLLIALVDRITGSDWGFGDYMWEFLGFLGFGLVAWVFNTLIQKLLLSYVRHPYGQEPTD